MIFQVEEPPQYIAGDPDGARQVIISPCVNREPRSVIFDLFERVDRRTLIRRKWNRSRIDRSPCFGQPLATTPSTAAVAMCRSPRISVDRASRQTPSPLVIRILSEHTT